MKLKLVKLELIIPQLIPFSYKHKEQVFFQVIIVS